MFHYWYLFPWLLIPAFVFLEKWEKYIYVLFWKWIFGYRSLWLGNILFTLLVFIHSSVNVYCHVLNTRHCGGHQACTITSTFRIFYSVSEEDNNERSLMSAEIFCGLPGNVFSFFPKLLLARKWWWLALLTAANVGFLLDAVPVQTGGVWRCLISLERCTCCWLILHMKSRTSSHLLSFPFPAPSFRRGEGLGL